MLRNRFFLLKNQDKRPKIYVLAPQIMNDEVVANDVTPLKKRTAV